MRRIVSRVFGSLGKPAFAPLWVLAIAAVVLLPDLPRPGLWEPHELQMADAAVARNERADQPPTPPAAPAATPPAARPGTAPPAAEPPRCPATAPKDSDGPRTLTERLAAFGLQISDSDGGMRLPIALLGLLCAIATCGIAIRLGSARAGLIAGLACLSFPLFVLDSRMLDGDIGTPTAAALIVYGAVAMATPRLRPGAYGMIALALDGLGATAALAVGLWMGWNAGGAFLGLLVPVGAIAAADGLGVGLPRAIRARRGVATPPSSVARSVVALVAALGALALILLLADQIYSWAQPTTGHRELFGHSIVPVDCWSSRLGGMWKVDDDIRMGVDSVFEQIAFGTYPVGVLAPIALVALAGGADDRRRAAGRIALAWAGASWIATQIWHRKVGFALWPGFPALAVGIGVWLDGVLTDRAAADRGDAPDPGAPPLLAMYAVAAVATIAMDWWAFPDRLVSLLVGGDSEKYPPHAKILGVPLRAWVCLVGVAFALLFAVGAVVWRPARGDRRHPAVRFVGRRALAASIASMLALSFFWAWGWHDRLSRHLSSKHVFSMYRDLHKDGEVLGIKGDMGNAPRYYAGTAWESIPTLEKLMDFLERPARVFALVPSQDLCAIHRAAAGKKYFVLDDSNPRTLLISNQLDDDEEDLNPLHRTVLRSEPAGIETRPKSPIVYDNKLELIGWNVPAEASFGSTIQVTLFFKVKDAVGGSWEIFEHFDPPSHTRFVGDHFPIHNTCATSFWQKGDYIVDEYDVDTGGVGLSAGPYDLWVGFFTGQNPNWTNMKVTAAPAGTRDDKDRVHIATIDLD